MSDWKSYAGEMSDREVARRFGIGASTVRRFRHSSDIPKFFPGRAELPAALVTQLAMETNHRLAKGNRPANTPF